MFRNRLLAVILPLAFGAATAAGAVSVDEILAAGGDPMSARGLNAIFADPGTAGALPVRRGFRIAPGGARPEDLGTLSGFLASVAHASNAGGQIVGAQDVPGGRHAVLWDAAGVTDLGDLPGGAVAGVARDINAAGQVVGRGETAEGPRAFLWEPGTGLVDLNDRIAPEGGLVLLDARAIDAEGRVAGLAQDATGPRGFVWDPEAGLLDLADAPDMRLAEITAFGPETRLVGRALSVDGRDRPVLWSAEDGVRDLDTLPGGAISGVALAINDASEIVGRITTDRGERAFLWDTIAGMVDLNDLILAYEDVTLTGAVEIDDRGRILAYGPRGGEIHFFVLEPEANDLAAAAGMDVADLGMGYDKGLGAGGYTLTDLGAFLVEPGAIPALSMDETGRMVGGCDPAASACPYLEGLEMVTNLFDGDAAETFDMPVGPVYVPSVREPFIGPVGGNSGARRTPPVPTFPGGFFPGGGGGTGGDPDDEGGTPPPTPRPDLPAVPLPSAWLGLVAALALLARLRRRGAAA